MNEFTKGEDWRLLVVSFGAFVLLLGGQKLMVGFYFGLVNLVPGRRAQRASSSSRVAEPERTGA